MLVSLSDKDKLGSDPTSRVGGKAASLMTLYSTPALVSGSSVPQGFSLTVDFFAPWTTQLQASDEWKQAMSRSSTTISVEQCDAVKSFAKTLSLNTEQGEVIQKLQSAMKTGCWYGGRAAVRSSAPEEDGSAASFAGAFETKLGVNAEQLEAAIRDCFASRFDYRVLHYNTNMNTSSTDPNTLAFAVVVMEMVDSAIAGVAFSANPLNSDLDELVVDSSYGIGESVVDGTVDVDHYVYDKIGREVIEKQIGSKQSEKRLRLDIDVGSPVETMPVESERQRESSLSEEQLHELAKLVCLVEDTYKQPMDVEWAYDARDDQLKLLQARPITTIFQLDKCMLTQPGERRILYYDYNIASEATTTNPFTHMDLTLCSELTSFLFSISSDIAMFKEDPNMPMFNASTRQYCNLSLFLRHFSPAYFADQSAFLDPYLASLFSGSECDRDRYRMHRKDWPRDVNLRNLIWCLRQFPTMKYYGITQRFVKNPKASKEAHVQLWNDNLAAIRKVGERGLEHSDETVVGPLRQYIQDLYDAIIPSLETEMAVVMFQLVPLFSKLDTIRREGKSAALRAEYDALCGGYEGDELMETNMDMYRLARKLPEAIWNEYDQNSLSKLADRIEQNLAESPPAADLPQEFLDDWVAFLDNHGYDGQDQLFVSSARYVDSPTILLAKLRHNVGEGILDPSVAMQKNAEKRRKIMALHEEQARKSWFGCKPGAVASIRHRNALLDHIMCMRNSPKIHCARLVGMVRQEILKIEKQFISIGRLEQVGDIFHLNVAEVDEAILDQDKTKDLMKIVRPRKEIYERAVRSKQCPMLVDSRCRILKPDVKGPQEPGTFIGSPVAPGIATGRVRVVHHPTDPLEAGEVLIATVTDPAWTPMFAGAAAVVLQIGGVLQHGALCAREYGKPAVSSIDVMAHFKTGMMVSVDGNTGVVKILDDHDGKTANSTSSST